MIDRRELLKKARERNLTLNMIEKDYVLGWLLHGLAGIRGMIFKGGTALSKVYFPKIWRLSEDLDFVYTKDFTEIVKSLDRIFKWIENLCGIKLRVESQHSNPEYLQLKIQYDAVLGKNWIKVDVTREAPIDNVLSKSLSQVYSDYPSFRIRVESMEEICAEKIRALIERRKCRDYYDVWQLMQLKPNKNKIKRLFAKKLQYKDMNFKGMNEILPDDLSAILKGYWYREIGRLIHPVPEMGKMIRDLKGYLKFLKTQ